MSPALRVCVAQLSSGFGRICHSKTHTQVKGRDKNYEVPLPLNRKVSSKMPGDKPKGLLSNSCLDRHSGKYQSTAQDRRPPPSHLVQQTEDESLSGTSVSPFLSSFESVKSIFKNFIFIYLDLGLVNFLKFVVCY